MHIAQIIDTLQLAGGAQKMQLMFAQMVQGSNVELTVISLEDLHQDDPIPAELHALGVGVIFFPAGNLLSPARFWRLVSFLRRESFDIIHANLVYANIVGTLAGRLAGIPVVAGIRNSQIRKRRFHQFRYGLETFVLRYLAQRVMAVGYETAEAHRARLGNRHIDPIPNCVEIAPSCPPAVRTALRRQVLGDPSRPLIITVGRLVPQKGYHDLLDAFAMVHSQHPRAALLIVGNGKLYDELAQRIADLGLEGHAILLGPRTDVLRLLGASDIFVSSSHWEGLSNALLEAMATGLPVVATNVSDTPRVVVKGTGLLVTPKAPAELAQAMNTLLANPQRAKEMGTAARNHVARYHDPLAWSKELLALYEDVIQAARPRSRRQPAANGSQTRVETVRWYEQ